MDSVSVSTFHNSPFDWVFQGGLSIGTGQNRDGHIA